MALEKIDKLGWRAAPCAGPLTVRAEVYACDLSVRGAHLDTTHGFLNGSCVFLRPLGRAAGDVIAAIDGARARGLDPGLDPVLDGRRAGDEIVLHVFRRDELLVRHARLRASPRDTCVLSLRSTRLAAPLRRWLGA